MYLRWEKNWFQIFGEMIEIPPYNDVNNRQELGRIVISEKDLDATELDFEHCKGVIKQLSNISNYQSSHQSNYPI